MNPHIISGKTQIVGLIGYPVTHSISPPMHGAAFAKLGLDWSYIPLPVPTEPPGRLGEAVHGLRALGLRGCNITVPHKQAVIPFLDSVSTVVQAIGAVNTIRVEEDGTFYGDNTDAPGFIRDLSDHGTDPKGMHAVILGAGGSARAVVFGLAEAGCKSITILNRTLSKADDLAATMQPFFQNCTISAGDSPGDIRSSAEQADLIVNCTSLGMTPNIDTTPWDESVSFRPDQVAYDLVYNPRQTRFLRMAKEAGAKAINGLGMLVWQGAISFEIWTGKEAPIEVMFEAVEKAMAEKNK
ncbi:MAG: shikimate dehydrogenase [Chloroflexota bacterium]